MGGSPECETILQRYPRPPILFILPPSALRLAAARPLRAAYGRLPRSARFRLGLRSPYSTASARCGRRSGQAWDVTLRNPWVAANGVTSAFNSARSVSSSCRVSAGIFGELLSVASILAMRSWIMSWEDYTGQRGFGYRRATFANGKNLKNEHAVNTRRGSCSNFHGL
jgi:hypothetical protein